jgi:DNA/RNA-binding protein KIN17
VSDEQRERMLIAEQIERAAAEEPESESVTPPADEGLKREEGGEKVVLSLSAKPAASKPAAAAPVSLKLGANPLKANPLKRPNPLKASAASGTSQEAGAKRPASAAMSAAEKLILEDQERKRRRMERESA